jgi:predicted Fe-Mo cluster-binding NifX family protein
MSGVTGTTTVLSIRVAVATSDGVRVDQHFSRASHFDIYDVSNDTAQFVERRENKNASCGCHDDHGAATFESIISGITDCRFIIAQRIGNGAISYLIDRGIRASQTDDTVDVALKNLVQSGKLKNLLRRQERN